MEEVHLFARRSSSEVFDKNKKYLFLGQWHIGYKEENLPKEYQVLAYHWNDRNKFFRDSLYLEELYESHLLKLSSKLNIEHGVDYPILYWRILIGPWLGEFIQVLYDRWETIQAALSKYSIVTANVVAGSFEDYIPNDMHEFQKQCIDDEWNEMIFGQLLGLTDIEIKFSKYSVRQERLEIVTRTSTKKSLKILITRISNLLGKNSKYFFIQTYLPTWKQVLLQFHLRQFPGFWFSKDPPRIKLNAFSALRKNPIRKKCLDFIEVLDDLLFKNIPLVYLEGYDNLIDCIGSLDWPTNPKTIFTSNSFFADDIFNAWTANKVLKGAKLIAGQHGGGYGMMKYFFHENHQKKISTNFLKWGNYHSAKCNTTIAGAFINGFAGQIKTDFSGNVLLIECAVPRYSTHLASMFISTQWLDYFGGLVTFYQNLPGEIKPFINLRLYKEDYGWSRRERWLDKFSDIKFDDERNTLLKSFKKCRICICTYNGTTYLQSLALNIPTIIFWDSNHFELNEMAKEDFFNLKSVGIFHETAESAAKHLGDIFEKTEEWWRSPEVQAARSQFCKRYADIGIDAVKALQEAFKN